MRIGIILVLVAQLAFAALVEARAGGPKVFTIASLTTHCVLQGGVKGSTITQKCDYDSENLPPPAARWYFEAYEPGSWLYKIVNVGSGRCMDVRGFGLSTAVQIIPWDCKRTSADNDANQWFWLRRSDTCDNCYFIQSAWSKLYLGLLNCPTTLPSPLVQRHFDGHDACQEWGLVPHH